ncbi:hypothetical protein Nmel_015069 [Mimus melanotis]
MMPWSSSDFPILCLKIPGISATLSHGTGHGQGCAGPALRPSPCQAPLPPAVSPTESLKCGMGSQAKQGAGRACPNAFPLPLSFSLPFLAPSACCPALACHLPRAFPCTKQPLEPLEARGSEAAGTLAGGSHSSPAGWEELRAAEQPLKHDPTPPTVYEAGTQDPRPQSHSFRCPGMRLLRQRCNPPATTAPTPAASAGAAAAAAHGTRTESEHGGHPGRPNWRPSQTVKHEPALKYIPVWEIQPKARPCSSLAEQRQDRPRK